MMGMYQGREVHFTSRILEISNIAILIIASNSMVSLYAENNLSPAVTQALISGQPCESSSTQKEFQCIIKVMTSYVKATFGLGM